MGEFHSNVLNWFDEHGRHDLPWQVDRSPYRVWISEIMLQQTQVATVIPYYQRFMARFPDIETLARSDIDQVLHLWTGLGYYARARNLHACARQVVEACDGKFPTDVEQISALPGIGRSTAGAIAALAMDLRAPILDGNVKRVLTRYFAIEGYPEQAAIKKRLWTLAEELLPRKRVADYTQAMMDLGSMVCTRSKPLCEQCPLARRCKALKENRVNEFPGRKSRKPLPVKSVYMLIMLNNHNEVRLEKRPPSGIWGGLYSLPELTIDESGAPRTKNNNGWTLYPPQRGGRDPILEQGTQLPPLRHTFSHYHLDITPVVIRQARTTAGIADSGDSVWYPLDHSLEVGLAAPVKKIISQLREQQ